MDEKNFKNILSATTINKAWKDEILENTQVDKLRKVNFQIFREEYEVLNERNKIINIWLFFMSNGNYKYTKKKG